MIPRNPQRRVVRIVVGERYSTAILACGHRVGVLLGAEPRTLGCDHCRRASSRRQLSLFPDTTK